MNGQCRSYSSSCQDIVVIETRDTCRVNTHSGLKQHMLTFALMLRLELVCHVENNMPSLL